jgi:carbon monoxide dehydrogenase subunit G
MTALQRIRDAIEALVKSTLPNVSVVTTEDAAFASTVPLAVTVVPLDAEPSSRTMLAYAVIDQPFSISVLARGADPVSMIEAAEAQIYAAIHAAAQLGDARWEWKGDRWEHSQMGDGSYAVKRVIFTATYQQPHGQR